MNFCLDCGLYSKEKINVNPLYVCRCVAKPVEDKKICAKCNLYEDQDGINPLYLCKCNQVVPQIIESLEKPKAKSKNKKSKTKATKSKPKFETTKSKPKNDLGTKPKAKSKPKPKVPKAKAKAKKPKYVKSRTVENPNSQDGRFYDYVPTKKEIEDKTAEFRRKWSDEDYNIKSGLLKKTTQYEVPIVSISDFCFDA